MMDTVYVKPREGGRIRQPERNGKVMPDGGAPVPRDSYYERLLISGDVVETDPPANTKIPAMATAGAEAKPLRPPPPARND
jgi:hypothetical protein